MNTETTITLSADDLPLMAYKCLANGEYVELEADSPDANSYTVRRCYMGSVLWQETDLDAAEAAAECVYWGLDGWTFGLYGD